MKIGDLVQSRRILYDKGAMGSKSKLLSKKIFNGYAVVVDITYNSALVLLDSGDTMFVKTRHLEVVNEMDSETIGNKNIA